MNVLVVSAEEEMLFIGTFLQGMKWTTGRIKHKHGLLLIFGSLCLVVQAHGLQEGDVLLQLHNVALQPGHLLREFVILLPQLVEQVSRECRSTRGGEGGQKGLMLITRVFVSVCVCVPVCV